MKKFFWLKAVIVAVVIAILIFGAIVVAKTILPSIAKKQIIDAVEKNCATCKFSLESVDVSLFPGELTLNTVHLKQGKKGLTVTDAAIPRLKVGVSFWGLLQKKFDLQTIRATDPVVSLVDGDAPHPPRKRSAKPHPDPFSIDRILVENATFIYVRIYQGREASLTIKKINADIDRLGANPDLVDSAVSGRADAVFEKSGHLNVQLKTYLFRRPAQVDLDVEVRKQNLGDLTPFFDKNDGVQLKGYMIEGHGRVNLAGEKLHSTVYAKYEDFDLKFAKTGERDPLLTFLMNIGAGIIMNKKNKDHPKSRQTKGIEATREPDESLVSFILRGLKEAAIEVAETP